MKPEIIRRSLGSGARLRERVKVVYLLVYYSGGGIAVKIPTMCIYIDELLLSYIRARPIFLRAAPRERATS